MTTIRTTSRMISAYAETEPWKKDHDLAMACRDLEESMAWGVGIFRILTEVETAAQAEALQGQRGQDTRLWQALEDNYRRLLECFEQINVSIQECESQGFIIEGLGKFNHTLEEARDMVGNLDLESETPSFEDLRASLKPENPRPDRYGK